ncbi:MAG: AsmA-like C-terminal region-containing protein [Rhodoferax sp.]
MFTKVRTVAVGLAVLATAVSLFVLALAVWLPNDDDLAGQLSTRAEDALGVKVSVGSVHWSLFPKPVVTINDFRTQQAHPVVIGKLRVYPSLTMLLHRKLVLDRVEVEDSTVPRNSLHALRVKAGVANQYSQAGLPLAHVAFRNITWISYSGIATTYDGDIDFDAQWRPRYAQVRRPGVTPPFTLTLTRDAEEDRWQMRILVGGGTADGKFVLKTAEDGAMHLTGHLAPRDVEVASGVSAFNRRSPVSGKASGETDVSAEGKTVGELTRSLHTRTQFTVSSAIFLRFDLDKAIRTFGKEHEGQTPLQELTGQLDTQNGPEGMRVTGTDIRGRAGKFTATGKGTVYHGQIEATANVDLVEGAVGVPVTLSGSVHKPKVSVPPGVVAGAAIGTVVLPVIGTAIGARIGGAVGKLFNGGAQKSRSQQKETVPK